MLYDVNTMAEESNRDDATRPNSAHHHVVPGVRNRWVLLHYHIFKNAGSTIESVLQRSFGSRFATLDGPDAGSTLNPPEIISFLEAHPDLAAISSHQIRYPKPVAPQLVVFDICFLRDPLQRLWSMYKFMRRSQPGDASARDARSLSARSFFEDLLEHKPYLLNDVQVCALATRGEYTRPPTSSDLRLALETMIGISVLGVVELFDESVLAAEYFLRPMFPELQFHYVKQNADPSRQLSPEKEKEEFRSQVGDSIYGQLERMNQLDIELMAGARSEVMRRWALLPSKDARVADFRKRCQVLLAAAGA
jgi:Sulfotransferase family